MRDEAERVTAGRAPEALVVENLKTLRLLHQILMLAAAAILVFALPADRSDDYGAAVVELQTIQELRADGWGSFVEERFKKEAAENNDVARQLIQKLGLTVPPGTEVLEQPFLGKTPPDTKAATLADLKAFLSVTHRIGILDLRSLDVPKAVSELLPDVRVGVGQFLRGVSIHVPGEAASESAVKLFALGDQSTSTQATLNVDIGNRFGSRTFTWICTIIDDKGKPQDWLRNDATGRKLLDSKTGELFPHLSSVWGSVRARRVGDAISSLHGQLAEIARGTLSFFGIPIERSLVVSAGPTVCFAILVFFVAHLRHFRRIAAGTAEVRAFPWIPLFRGRLPFAMTCVTVFLPVFSNAILLYRFGHLGCWLVVGIVIAMAVPAIYALCEIGRLRV